MKQILTDFYSVYFCTMVEAKGSSTAVEAAGRQQAGGGSAAASGGTGSRQAAAAQRQAAVGRGQMNDSKASFENYEGQQGLARPRHPNPRPEARGAILR